MILLCRTFIVLADKHCNLDMQRFQVSYNLKVIPEVQDYLNVSFENSKRSGDFQDLYRRRYVVHASFKRELTMSVYIVSLWNLSSPLIPLLRVICGSCSTGRRGLNRQPPLRNTVHPLAHSSSSPFSSIPFLADPSISFPTIFVQH